MRKSSNITAKSLNVPCPKLMAEFLIEYLKQHPQLCKDLVDSRNANLPQALIFTSPDDKQ